MLEMMYNRKRVDDTRLYSFLLDIYISFFTALQAHGG